MAERFGWVHRQDGLEIELVELPVAASPQLGAHGSVVLVQWEVASRTTPEYPTRVGIAVELPRHPISELMARRVRQGFPTEVMGTQWPAIRVYTWTDGAEWICSIFCSAPKQAVVEVIVSLMGPPFGEADVFALAHRHVRIRAL